MRVVYSGGDSRKRGGQRGGESGGAGAPARGPHAGATARTAGAQGRWGHCVEALGTEVWALAPPRPRVLLFQPAARRLRRAPGRGSRVPAGVLCWHPGDSGRRGDTGGTPMASLIEREGGEEGRDGARGFREPAAPETALNSAPGTAVARPVRRGQSASWCRCRFRSNRVGGAGSTPGIPEGRLDGASCHGNRCRLRGGPASGVS